MRKQTNSVVPLLVISLLFFISFIVLHLNKSQFFRSFGSISQVSPDLLRHVTALLENNDYTGIGHLANSLPFINNIQLTRILFKSDLIKATMEQRLQAIFKIIALSTRRDYQKALLRQLDFHKVIFEKPFFVFLAEYADTLFPLVLRCLSEQYSSHFVNKVSCDAYRYAITNNNPVLFHVLAQNHITILENQATDLLIQVMKQDKSKAFIPLLISIGANLQKNIMSKKLLLYARSQ